ncbi:unnamed protein product [Owenia fusiformis]|uniref:Eukaryotic translation initiation factor 2 subunit 2 n=1 Tax=Owenia fusiformis TaxID=6347 RepID=A0A8J1TVW2_OWEFU|nr:unnamed protein product [Owenia fusiformis]
MTEEEALFDPTMKKKKKKKKTVFDPDAPVDGGTVETPTETKVEVTEKQDEEVKENKVELDFTDDFGGKKKKKKKKVFDMEEVKDAVPESEDKTEENDNSTQKVTDTDLDLDFTKQKKKKRKKITFDEDTADKMETEDKDDDGTDFIDSSGPAWSGSDRDYTYDELLTRVFDKMREKNPDMVAGEKKRFVMKPPQVMRVGTKKSSFSNFAEICKALHRQPKHLLAFLLAELGTSGSIDGMNQLIIKGRFQQKQIENVLRRYIKEYVTCHTCRSPDTILQKDTRLFFLQCETCGSRCSVASIQSGFKAVTGKRAAIRAKTS